jgi:hypothetical protein
MKASIPGARTWPELGQNYQEDVSRKIDATIKPSTWSIFFSLCVAILLHGKINRSPCRAFNIHGSIGNIIHTRFAKMNHR